MKAYDAWRSQLYARANRGMKLSLDVMQEALGKLAAKGPWLARVIVGGTNGKGSTASALEAVVRHAGYSTGFFSSPHLMRLSERLRVDGQELSPSTLLELGTRVEAIENSLSRPLSFFEYVTAMAAIQFASCDVAIYEVGLGGRLDATNAVSSDLAVMTPIGLDHTHILGDTIDKIATEKSYIIPENGVLVSAPQVDEAREVLTRVASHRGARLVWAKEELVGALEQPAYQRVNLATALTAAQALESFGLHIDGDQARAALSKWQWPGRYHHVKYRGVDVLFDVAHNAHGVDALITALNEDARFDQRPRIVLASLLRDRDPKLLAPLCRPGHEMIVTTCHSPRTRVASELATDFPECTAVESPHEAWELALEKACAAGGLLVVTGSQHFVGPILALALGEPCDPPVDG